MTTDTTEQQKEQEEWVDQNQEDLKNLQQEIITNYAKKIQKELKSDQSLENIVQKIEEELKKGWEEKTRFGQIYDKLFGNITEKIKETADKNGRGRILSFFATSKEEKALNEEVKIAAEKIATSTTAAQIAELKKELGIEKKEEKSGEDDGKKEKPWNEIKDEKSNKKTDEEKKNASKT